MLITVPNSDPQTPRVTLFGRLDDGRYAAEVMDETAVPYSPYWENEQEQVVVYIDPDETQLSRMLDALQEGRLEFDSLQQFGSSNGGTSNIPL
jgi:hypothetical protein